MGFRERPRPYVSGAGLHADDLIRLYGSKFKSSLPADLKIDKTAWGRREMDLTVDRLRRILDGAQLYPAERGDPFYWHLSRLGHVFVPVVALADVLEHPEGRR